MSKKNPALRMTGKRMACCSARWFAAFCLFAILSASPEAFGQQLIQLPDLNLGPGSNLPVQIGGTTPIVEHDLYDIATNASLEGRLDLRLINGFQANVGDQVVFLEAETIQRQFRSHFFPVPFSNDESVAVELSVVQQSPLLATFQADFVPADASIQFSSLDADVFWSDAQVWSTGEVPDSKNVLAIQGNATAPEQLIRVVGGPVNNVAPATAHEIILSQGTRPLAVRVSNGAHLSASLRTVIDPGARVELLQGQSSLISQEVIVNPDGAILMDQGVIRAGINRAIVSGLLLGNGEVIGGLQLVDAPINQQGGRLEIDAPSDPSATIQIQGDYFQSATSTLSVDALSEAQHEMLNIRNEATLGGTLEVDITNFDDFQLGTTFDVLMADVLTPGTSFRRVNVDDNLLGTGIYAGVVYNNCTVSIIGHSVGDMNGDFAFDQTDVDLFALALRDREAYELTPLPGGGIIGISADITGDTDYDGDLDFDDIDDMISLLPSPIALYAQQTLLGIPEPSSIVLIALGGLLVAWNRLR